MDIPARATREVLQTPQLATHFRDPSAWCACFRVTVAILSWTGVRQRLRAITKCCPVRRTEPAHAGKHVMQKSVDLREQSAKAIRHKDAVIALKEPPAPDAHATTAVVTFAEGRGGGPRGRFHLIRAPGGSHFGSHGGTGFRK
jgi:hypothetical protein